MLDPVTDAAGLRALQAATETVQVDESVGRYCVALAAATREHGDVLTGSSPRGSLGLVLCARGFAVLRGRDYVIPEDVKAVARAVLGAPDHGAARALDDRGQRPPASSTRCCGTCPRPRPSRGPPGHDRAMSPWRPTAALARALAVGGLGVALAVVLGSRRWWC